VSISGVSLLLGANASNFGSMYVMLEDFEQRKEPGLSGEDIAAKLRAAFDREIKQGIITVFGAPPVDGLGTAGGFKIMIEDRTELGPKPLQSATAQVVEDAGRAPGLTGLFTSFRADTPWLQLDINRQQARMLGVSTAEIFTTLQVNIGSLYVNDFNRFGRTWQVNLQAEQGFRKTADDLRKLKIRSERGDMVPLASFCRIVPIDGPVLLTRYNMYSAAAINSLAAPGTSSGQAIAQMEKTARQSIPGSMRAEWTELAFMQQDAGDTAMLAFLLAVVLVFLVLAAQYESWTLPLAVILVVPMCLLCAIAGVIGAKLDINIFTQIGFVVLVGLACKNAILIVELAKLQREKGHDARQATLEACQLRLRPILMTSFAFILGVVPLVLAHGAGAEMRQTLGTAVLWGMLGVTLFGIFLTPVFFYAIAWASEWPARRRKGGEAPPAVAVKPAPVVVETHAAVASSAHHCEAIALTQSGCSAGAH
jgi:multidrug efflux pump subunit AcrB